MSVHLLGQLDSVRTEERHRRTGEAFEVTTAILLGRGVTYYVELGDRFDQATLPGLGEDVALDVTPRPYIGKDGNCRMGWRGKAVVDASAAGLRSIA